jgi:ureidoglycolate lyase
LTEFLPILPLTKAAFAPYGDVIEADPASMRLINGGTTERFHALSVTQASGVDPAGVPLPVIISMFRGQPRSFPYALEMMERHPYGSQSFSPLSGRPFLVAVSDDHDGIAGVPKIFLAGPHQGVNYRANIWHHPLMALGAVSDFLVVDRENPGGNLQEFFFETPYLVAEPSL